MATREHKTLIGDELMELLELLPSAQSVAVELKVTVPESAHQSTAAALELDPLDAQIRQVYFFDTPELALYHSGVVARARRVQGKGDDSVIKLRPVVVDDLPSEVRQSPNLVVEVDVMPGGFVCSASLKARRTPTPVRTAVRGDAPLRKLFTKEQRAFYAAYAPTDVGLDDLDVLGPILVLKLPFTRPDYARGRVVAELWLYPDGTRILELSTKCSPPDAISTGVDARKFLQARGVDLDGEQQTKTKTALEFFAAELSRAAVG